MASRSEINSQIREYRNLKDKVNEIVTTLKKSVNSLQTATSDFIEYFSIDDLSGDNEKIKKTRNNIQDIIDTLTRNVIPSIESKISDLYDDLEDEDDDDDDRGRDRRDR